jgi:asparagine synthase (glutamine-hydrolysing)
VLNGMPTGMPNGMQALSLPERMMLADQLDYLPDDLLAKMDRASMSASLEVRAPLLDHRLAALAWRLDPSLKIRDGRTKWILRRLLARDVPPALFERPKMGFSVPVRAWLTGPLRPWAEDLLSVESLRRIPALDPSAVQRAWRDLLAGRAGNGVGIWAVLHLVAWWRRWEPTDVQHAGP